MMSLISLMRGPFSVHVCRGVRYPNHTCVSLVLDYDWLPNYFLSQNHLVCLEFALKVNTDEHSTFSRGMGKQPTRECKTEI